MTTRPLQQSKRKLPQPQSNDGLVWGCEVPRIFTPPLRELTPATSLGFAFIKFVNTVANGPINTGEQHERPLPLLPWQEWLAIHLLELLPSGKLRFRKVVILVARQNGKSTFLAWLLLFFMYMLGRKQLVGTAQKLDIAEDLWQKAVDIAQASKLLSGKVKHVDMVNGKKALRLRNRARYKVVSGGRRGARGLSGCEVAVLDELREHQNWLTWAAVTKTTQAKAEALILAASNAGDVSSVVLSNFRLVTHKALGDPDGIVGDSLLGDVPEGMDFQDSSAIFEWSAAPGADRWDERAWAQANPSYRYTIMPNVIASDARDDPDHVFFPEVLCQWVETLVPDSLDEVNRTTWAQIVDPDATPSSQLRIAFDVAPGQASSAICVVGSDTDGRPVGEVIAHRRGTRGLLEEVRRLCLEHGVREASYDPTGPAGSMESAMAEISDIDFVPLPAKDVLRSGTAMTAAVTSKALTVRADSALDAAVEGLVSKRAGDGIRWSRLDSSVDICPFMALTFAHWAWTEGPVTYSLGASVH